MADRGIGKSQAVNLQGKVGELMGTGALIGAGAQCISSGCKSAESIATIPASGVATWILGEGLEWAFFDS
jgi:hypothetical protein